MIDVEEFKQNVKEIYWNATEDEQKAMNTDLKTGYYTISTDNNYLGLSREVAYNGSIPVLQQVKNINTQTWYIKNIRNNLYEIKYGLNPNKVLEVKGGKKANGT